MPVQSLADLLTNPLLPFTPADPGGAVLWILAVLLVLAGLIGTLLPAIPGGAVLVLAGLLLAAWADDFERVGWGVIAILVILTVLSYLADLGAAALGARGFGASRRAVFGAALGALVGLFLGLPGILLGPFLGAVLAELSLRRDFKGAGLAGFGAWIGMLLGLAAKVAIVFTMLGVFAAAYWL